MNIVNFTVDKLVSANELINASDSEWSPGDMYRTIANKVCLVVAVLRDPTQPKYYTLFVLTP